ncbi:hypothetical protein GGD81_003160 [Rhodobium orientis]|nr:hypothetical protein [Rhodobium orientis]
MHHVYKIKPDSSGWNPLRPFYRPRVQRRQELFCGKSKYRLFAADAGGINWFPAIDLSLDQHRFGPDFSGLRRIFGDLRDAGESCGLHRVERIMRENGIKPVRGYKKLGLLLAGPRSSLRTGYSARLPSMRPTRSG